MFAPALSAFNDDVHFGLCYKIARFADLSESDAIQIAAGNRATDYSPTDQPAANVFQRSTADKPTYNMHFLYPKVAVTALTLAIARIKGVPGSDARKNTLFQVGKRFHSLNDIYSHPHTGTSHKNPDVDLTSNNLDITWMMAKHMLHEMLMVKAQLQKQAFDKQEYEDKVTQMENDFSFYMFFLADSKESKKEALESWDITPQLVARANKITWVQVGKKRPWNREKIQSTVNLATSASIMMLPIPGARIIGGIFTGFFALRETYRHLHTKGVLAKNSEHAGLSLGAVKSEKNGPKKKFWSRKPKKEKAMFSYASQNIPPALLELHRQYMQKQMGGTFDVWWNKYLEEKEKKRAETAAAFFADIEKESDITRSKMFDLPESVILKDAYFRGEEFEKNLYRFDGGKVDFKLSNLKYVPWIVSGAVSSIGKLIGLQMGIAISKTQDFIRSIPQRIKGSYKNWKKEELAKEKEEERSAIEREPYSFEQQEFPADFITPRADQAETTALKGSVKPILSAEPANLKDLNQKMTLDRKNYIKYMETNFYHDQAQAKLLYNRYQQSQKAYSEALVSFQNLQKEVTAAK
ncbi:hypothetical protein ACFL35_01725 [Candidatus Riflebacteria bacterium]